ncbi:hypothetical protein [Desulforapulum autotrophicum]|jgi:hypothetical protein|uniref:hypothetical protein n=1 Tax=Desulforapulum autotrophicum TaxID=2296 RepID=UPI00059D0D46|nr:hypothetical protein [Desulforapulum autotrophicum]
MELDEEIGTYKRYDQLICQINQALGRIDNGRFGWCQAKNTGKKGRSLFSVFLIYPDKSVRWIYGLYVACPTKRQGVFPDGTHLRR